MIFPKTSFLWPLLILEISIINTIWIDLKIFLKILWNVINFNKFKFLFDRLQRTRSNFWQAYYWFIQNHMAFTMHNIYVILSHLWSIKRLVILWDIQNINFQKDIMKYMLAQIFFGKKEKNSPWFQKPNPMQSHVLKTHPLNIKKNNFTWIKWIKTLIIQHLYNQIMKINIDMKDY